MKREKNGDKKSKEAIKHKFQDSSIKIFIVDHANRFFLVITAAVNVISWLLIGIILNSLPTPIILRYNSYFGIVLEGSPFLAFSLPLTGFFILLLNVILGIYFVKKNELASRVLIADSFLYNLLVVIAIVALIMVNRI